METIETRNEVTFSLEVIEQVREFESYLDHYRDDHEAFLRGIKETLEAEV